MANPILKDDLISQEALDALERMSKLLHDDALAMEAMIRATGQYAGSLGSMIQQQQQDNAALQTYAERIENLENALAKMQKMMAENKATQAALNDEKRKYKKLTDEEAESVRNLTRALAGTEQERKDAIEQINIEKKSYNELYQTYNAVKDALNRMTTAERTSTDVGKAMTAQALKLRDTLNELQKSTGNYTLQVGKYRAAFDGLGYSFQQILREAPSALNLNQFFLAISNNVPMFLDQLKAFKDEQAEIKANLAQMTEGTKEYAEQLSKVESVGKKLGRTLLSWQSLVLVGLLVIRNWERIVSGISDLFYRLTKEQKALREVNQGAASTVGELTAKYKALQKEWNNLKDADKGSWVKQHKDDWNELGISINNATDAENIYVKNTSTVQNAIDARARSIAAMKIASEKYEEAFRLQAKAEQDLASGKMGFGSSLSISLAGAGMAEGSGVLTPEQQASQERARKQSIKAYYENQMKAVKKLQEEAQYYITTWVLPDPLNPTKNGPQGKQPTEQSISDRYWEAERALLNAMEEGYIKEMEISDLERRKNRDEQEKWLAEQQANIEENVKNGFTTREKANEQLAELQRQFNALQEDEDRQHQERVVKIQMEYYKKQLTAREQLHNMQMKAIMQESKNDTVYVQRRVRNATQEATKNAQLTSNIEALTEAKRKLMDVEIAMDENKTIEERIKLLDQLNKQIAKYAQQISITQKIRSYSSVGDMFGRAIGGSVSGQGKEDLIGKILGEDAMKARIAGFQADNPDGWEKDYMDWLDGEFEEWGKQAMSAASTWYSTTMGYINDLIGAYVDLANAKAEAAKEATEAAQEEYEKEKALLEAGYASRVEATWAEYQEKKAAQEQAEKDAKAAAEAQQQLNEISTLGSLVTASANIWKTFTEIPVVGVPLAIAAIGTMFGSFLAAKMKAAQVSQYGEGGFEVLEGGSHASGHDIDLGVNNRRGRRMHVEGKEGLGIFRVKAMQHYGADAIENVVNGINHLEYEQSVGRTLSLQRDMGLHNTMILPRTNLHRLESGVDKLVAIGSNSRYYDPDGTEVITTASGTTRIRRR